MAQKGRRKTSLDAWLNAVSTPVYFIDSRKRVRFFNHGCVQFSGWPSSEVVGKPCEYHTEDEGVDQFLGSLCPPPSAFDGKGNSIPAFLTHREGRELACVQEFFPLIDENRGVEGVLVVLTPLDAMRKPATPTAAQTLHAELASIRQSLKRKYSLKSFLGQSPAMERVLARMQLARRGTESVWISGEEGSGREHIARTIHYESHLHSRAFVPLDCEKNAPVDLKQTWNRLLEMAKEPSGSSLHPGTVYFIAAEQMPRDLQTNIVEYVRTVSQQDEKIPIRLIAGSRHTVGELAGSDELLPEYLLSLSTLTIEVEPLRRRAEDIAPLAQHLLENRNRGGEQQLEGFRDEVLLRFQKYDWPGNVRELEQVIDEARASATGTFIEEGDLPFRFQTAEDARREGPPIRSSVRPLEETLEQTEREQIELALEQAGNNKTTAAKLLGIPRAKLYRRMEVLGIEDPEG